MIQIPDQAVDANRQPTEMMVWIADTISQAKALSPPTVANRAIPSASHCWQNATVSALNDQVDPDSSDDQKIPRFTWWNHRDTKEWVQYDFDRVEKVLSVEVYWWDELRINAHCRTPQSWRLLSKSGDDWKPVSSPSEYLPKLDTFNRVTFNPVETKSLRLEVQLQSNWAGGILKWRVE